MTTYMLDQEEQEILHAFKTGNLLSIPNAREEMEKHRKYAKATLKKVSKTGYSHQKQHSFHDSKTRSVSKGIHIKQL